MGSTSSSKLTQPTMSHATYRIVTGNMASGNMSRHTARGLHDLPTYNSNVVGMVNKQEAVTVGVLGGLSGVAYQVNPVRDWQARSIDQEKWPGQGQKSR